MSWIHHDSAIEGTVYDPSELVAALGQSPAEGVAVSPTHEEIRQHKAAIDLVRSMASQKKEAITLDTLRQIYAILVPEESDPKLGLKYRRDMPLHRVYFHEIAAPQGHFRRHWPCRRRKCRKLR
jgi:Fic family protein